MAEFINPTFLLQRLLVIQKYYSDIIVLFSFVENLLLTYKIFVKFVGYNLKDLYSDHICNY
jgi:hypothetical protein